MLSVGKSNERMLISWRKNEDKKRTLGNKNRYNSIDDFFILIIYNIFWPKLKMGRL